MAWKVVIAEDFKMMRTVFEQTVEDADEYELAASFPTARQAVEYCSRNPVQLVLMDVLFPGSISGLAASRSIKEENPKIRIIIMTSMPELTYERQAREIGIEGFWRKEVQEQSILEVMNRVMAGELVYPTEQLKIKLGNADSTEFTERELEVLKALVRGASNQGIADALDLKEPTVKTHIANLLQKTGFHSRLELAVKARHLGLAIED